MSTNPVVRRWTVLFASLAAALLAGLGLAPAALAHNTLISSSPEDEATVDEPLEEVVLTFDDDVKEGGNGIVVTGPDGTQMQDGEVELDGAKASIGLQPLTEPGDYTIDYRIVSADGHTLKDGLAFTLSEAGAAEPDTSPSAESPAGEASDEGAGNGGETATPADGDTPADPMSALGPIGGVIAVIAVIALAAILLLRMRGRKDGGA